MSEYQYYEFQAVDRPLTDREMVELRSHSTRARITPTSFVNDYSWGSFKGNQDVWMEKYFDAFLYFANWGTRTFQLRLPARALSLKTVHLYCIGDQASARVKNGSLILSFWSEDEEEGNEWLEAEGILSSLISVRAELARGDLRALYLGWLLCAQNGELDDDDVEPPVPPGLAQPSVSLERFAGFFRIDPDLIHVAAGASPLREDTTPKLPELRAWVAKLPAAEKDDLLARTMAGEHTMIANELIQRLTREQVGRNPSGAPGKRRTVRDLLDQAEQAAEERQRLNAERAAKEKARRAQEAAIARTKHLDAIAGNEPKLWKQVESLVATKQPKKYDFAVKLLVDLRDLAKRENSATFRRQLEELRTQHAGKPSLIERLRRGGL